MYRKKLQSFTLIEVVVVMGIMGLIMGGLLASLRQVIESETMLKKMQTVEEETRFIMDAFAQDAEYSELDSKYKPSGDEGDIFSYKIKFLLAGKKSEIVSDSLGSEYMSYTNDGSSFYLKRTLTDTTDPPTEDAVATLNNTPLMLRPVFRVKMIKSPDQAENFFITICLVFQIVNKDQTIYLPIETSAVSRTFEM